MILILSSAFVESASFITATTCSHFQPKNRNQDSSIRSTNPIEQRKIQFRSSRCFIPLIQTRLHAELAMAEGGNGNLKP